jgi:putative transposase
MAGEGLPVEVACRVLDVSCAGFYAWRFRPRSARAVRHVWLTDAIGEIHAASYGNDGAKRVCTPSSSSVVASAWATTRSRC